LWGKFVRRAPVVETRTECWPTPDDDEIEIRRLDAPLSKSTPAPRLLILHGLEGTIQSHYLRGMLSQARTRGWAADVLMFRGCNGKANRARRFYHSGETSDLDLVVRRLVRENPEQLLFVVGFSLGGNVLLKWLGEQGADAPAQLRAAAAISVPYDLERGARHIEHGFSRIYTMHFLRTLRRKALAKLEHFPGLFDVTALAQAKTLFDFDDTVTAPVHGFTDAHDYYARSSCLQYLSAICCSTLLISAYDDPFLPKEILDDVALVACESAVLEYEFWQVGGHVGFVSGHSPLEARFYAEERVAEFLDHQLDQASAAAT
jgi:predicted alpha/beta-fold hydrolase